MSWLMRYNTDHALTDRGDEPGRGGVAESKVILTYYGYYATTPNVLPSYVQLIRTPLGTGNELGEVAGTAT